ncbi:hypothetical protein RJ640_001341 [Escallonia rubra]|uniref:Nuclear pore complex protein n=1 Tax=Escallonia rubra TaxID=112253 RepID=A0AA88QXP9_9ASTE|nr:hypothetical protein RJ640_001341 [Escallonia rubra]
MATAGDGATSSYDGGAGGKFRKRPFRRAQSTPYDRPPAALRNPSGTSNGWISKLVVDPASKLFSSGVHMLYSSVFRKRLPSLPPPPPPPPEVHMTSVVSNRDSMLAWSDLACRTLICMRFSYLYLSLILFEVKNCTGDDVGKLTGTPDRGGISELEQMLKQKTFTRSEIECLTELLRSRTVELPVSDGNRTEANLLKSEYDHERREAFTGIPTRDTTNVNDEFMGTISTPDSNSRVLKADVASPAELAKAYMGSRPSKISPSMLGMRSQILKDDPTSLNVVPFHPKSPSISLVSKTAARVGVPENGFLTPLSRGRSAIYSMARTPYSRIQPTASQKGTGSSIYAYTGPSSTPSASQLAWEHDGKLGSKNVALKRRSSVLDDDIGSGGAIRRIRQKANLSYQGSPGTGVAYGAAQHHNLTQKLLLPDGHRRKSLKTVEENEDNCIPTTSYACVPSKSSEMATKILQHLEKLSPKEKPAESKRVLTEKSPAKLTPNMLHGQALRSLEEVDTSKVLENVHDVNKVEAAGHILLHDARESTSQKQDEVEQDGPKKFAVHRNMLTTSTNNDRAVSTKDTVVPVPAKSADSIIPKFEAKPAQKKWAFQMSAHEDSVELDDAIHSNGFSPTHLAESRGTVGTSGIESKDSHTEPVASPALPEVKAPEGSIFNKETFSGPPDDERKTGFTFPTSPGPITAPPIQSASVSDKVVPLKDSHVPTPLYSLGSKNSETVPSFKLTSSLEFSGSMSGAPSDPKPERSNSLVNVVSGRSDAQLDTFGSDSCDNKSTQKVEILETSASAAPNSATSSGAPAKQSTLENGPSSSASSPFIFSSAVPALAFSISAAPSSTSPSSMTFAGSTTTLPSPVPAAPMFTFGSSVAPSTSVSNALSTTAETVDKNAKKDNENVPSLLFGSSPFGFSSSVSSFSTVDENAKKENENGPSTPFGSSPFGFSPSVSSFATSSTTQSQGSPFGTGSGSMFSAAAAVSSSGTSVASVAQSMPNPFTSGSSSVFGTSGMASVTSGTSLFSSSNPASNHFSTSASFGLSSSTSSSLTISASSESGATPSIFASSWQPVKSSSIFNFSSPSQPPSFSFGASTTSVAATNSAPMVFGSSTGASSASPFPFTSSAATTSSLSSPTQVQLPSFSNSPAFTPFSSNSNQVNMEDSMAEDPVQASTQAAPIFGQSPFSPPAAGFTFGSTATSQQVPPFQFGGQQNQAPPLNTSPFQASSSVDFNTGGSFSLGSTVDKSNRKIYRPKKRVGKK